MANDEIDYPLNDEKPAGYHQGKAYTIDDKMQFVELFKSKATDVSRACKAFGISRHTFYNWYNDPNDKRFRDAIDDGREEIKDFGESQLLTLMRGIPEIDKTTGRQTGWVVRPDTACVIFFNKTRNKDRGYDERHIFKPEGDWGAGVQINVTSPENARKLQAFLTKSKPDQNGGG